MSCGKSDQSCCKGSHLLGWLFLFAAGAVFVACLPEIKRYIKISSM